MKLRHAVCTGAIIASMGCASVTPKAEPIVEPRTMSCTEATLSRVGRSFEKHLESSIKGKARELKNLLETDGKVVVTVWLGTDERGRITPQFARAQISDASMRSADAIDMLGLKSYVLIGVPNRLPKCGYHLSIEVD